MEKIIAYCGLVCTDCEAYIATQENDPDTLEQMAARMREQFNMPDISVEAILCDGCLGDGRKGGYCSQCKVRLCGVERGVVNCAHCAEYVCEELTSFFGRAPHAQTMLDEIRASL